MRAVRDEVNGGEEVALGQLKDYEVKEATYILD